MKAEVFCLDRDLAAAEMLKELLRDKLDQSITLTVHKVEEGPAWEREPLTTQYGRLLQASFPPSSDMSVDVGTQDWFEERVYLSITWRMYAMGRWEEVGGTSVFFESYDMYRSLECMSAPHKGLELFFPALALRDRMVLVPAGQDALLTRLVTPADNAEDVPRDVLEVDFRDREALERAVTTLSQRLVAETRREVAAYLSVHPGAELDVSALVAELGVSPALFERSMKEEASVYEQLSVELQEKKFIQGRWKKTGLLIRNNSSVHIAQIRVEISGPAEVQPQEIFIEIPPHSEVVQDVSIRAPDPGEFPLSIAVLLPQHERLASAFAHWVPPTHIWLESTPG
jgi:hypothetical protein